MKFIDQKLLMKQRSERYADKQAQYSLGLSRVGIVYIAEDFRASPMELFYSINGNYYVKAANSTYIKYNKGVS